MICSHCHEAVAASTYEGQPTCETCLEDILYSMAKKVMTYHPTFDEMEIEGLVGNV